MGTYIGFSNSVGATHGALLNQTPEVPEGALQFEGTEEYIFFEGDETEQYIIFEN